MNYIVYQYPCPANAHRWINAKVIGGLDDHWEYECGQCGYLTTAATQYCPRCGVAKTAIMYVGSCGEEEAM